MIVSYCHLCHKTITVETPPPKENTNPNNGHLTCHKCWDENFSTKVIRDKKLNQLLNPTPKDKLNSLLNRIKSILK